MKNSSKILVQVIAGMCLSMASAGSAYATTTCSGYPPRVSASSICKGSRVYTCKVGKYGSISPLFGYDCASGKMNCKEKTTYYPGQRGNVSAACVKK